MKKKSESEKKIESLSVYEYKKKYPAVYETTLKALEALFFDENVHDFVTIYGDPKVGKRKIITCFGAFSCSFHRNLNFANVYITAVPYNDFKNQLPEYDAHGFVYRKVVTRNEHIKEVITRLRQIAQEYEGKDIVVHFDECDYGTGAKQVFARVWEEVKKLRLKVIFYSATLEEIWYSKFIEDNNAKVICHIPDENYRGYQYYLENGLLHSAEKAYEKTENGWGITKHYEEIIEDFTKSDLPLGVLRLAYDKAFHKFNEDAVTQNRLLREYNVMFYFIYDKIDFEFSTSEYMVLPDKVNICLENFRRNHDDNGRPLRTIFVLNQKCSRSTEVSFLRYAHHWHDFRKEGTSYTTHGQAIGRVFHYEIGDPIRLKVYADVNVFTTAINVNRCMMEAKNIKEFKQMVAPFHNTFVINNGGKSRKLSSRVKSDIPKRAGSFSEEGYQYHLIPIVMDENNKPNEETWNEVLKVQKKVLEENKNIKMKSFINRWKDPLTYVKNENDEYETNKSRAFYDPIKKKWLEIEHKRPNVRYLNAKEKSDDGGYNHEYLSPKHGLDEENMRCALMYDENEQPWFRIAWHTGKKTSTEDMINGIKSETFKSIYGNTGGSRRRNAFVST